MSTENPYEHDAEQERELERIQDELTRLMGAAWGRTFAWRQLSRAGIFRSSFVEGDAHSTAFNEGRRSAGLQFMQDLITYCPEQFSRMFAENQ